MDEEDINRRRVGENDQLVLAITILSVLKSTPFDSRATLFFLFLSFLSGTVSSLPSFPPCP